MKIPLHSRLIGRTLLWLLLPVVTLTVLNASANGDSTKMLRSPAISATHIAFAYANNIWIVDKQGGTARRLTSFQGQTSNPNFSPDGQTIAFTGEYAGNADVYTVPAEGGEPRRLTWHPGNDAVQGWTPDGKSIIFA
jgi:tricorn protease